MNLSDEELLNKFSSPINTDTAATIEPSEDELALLNKFSGGVPQSSATDDEFSSDVAFDADWNDTITQLATKYPKVPEPVVRALIYRESSGNPDIDVDTGGKWGKARGLGQFIDETAKNFIPGWRDPADSYNPHKNIEGIYNYLSYLVDKKGNIRDALISYHGGGTDILGTKSTDYAEQILSKSGKDISFKPKQLSDDELLNKFSSLQEPAQTTDDSAGEIDRFSHVKPTEPPSGVGEFLSSSGKSLGTTVTKFISSMLKVPGAYAKSLAASSNEDPYAPAAKRGYLKTVLNEDGTTAGYADDKGNFIEKKKETKIPKQITTVFGATDKLDKAAEKISTLKEFDNEGVVDELVKDWNNKDFGRAAQYLWFGALEQAAPTFGSLIVAKATGNPTLALATMGASAAAEKSGELEDRADLSSSQKEATSLYTGIAEGVFESVTLGTFDPLFKVFKKGGKEAVKETLEQATKKGFKEALKKFGKGLADWEIDNLKESVSEMGTQLSQDIADIATGVNPNLTAQELISNSVGAGIMAHVSSMPMSTLNSVTKNAQNRPLVVPKQNKPVSDNLSTNLSTDSQDLSNVIEEFDRTPEQVEEDYKSEDDDGKAILRNIANSLEDETVRNDILARMDNADSQQATVEEQPATQEEPTVEEVQADVPSVQTVTEPQQDVVAPAPPPVVEEGTPTPSGKVKLTKEQWLQMDNKQLDDTQDKLGDKVVFEGMENIDEGVRKSLSESNKEGTATVEEDVTPEFKEAEVTPGITVVQNVRKSETETKSEPDPKLAEKGKALASELKNVKFDGVDKDGNLSFSYTHGVRTNKSSGKTYATKVSKVTIKPDQGVKELTSAIKTEATTFKTTKSVGVSVGMKKQQQKRGAETGDKRSETFVDRGNALKEIIDDGVVEFEPKKHSNIVTVTKDENGNSKPVFKNETLKRSLKIETINGKEYISVKESYFVKNNKKKVEIDPLSDLISMAEGNKTEIAYDENVRGDDSDIRDEENQTVDIDNNSSTPTSRRSVKTDEKTQDVEEPTTSIDDSFSKKKVKPEEFVAILRSKLSATKDQLTPEAYQEKLRLIEAYEREAGVSKVLEGDKASRSGKKSEFATVFESNDIDNMSEVKGSQKDTERGKTLANEVKDVKFDGVLPGLAVNGVVKIQPQLQFTDNKGTGTTFYIPLNGKTKDLIGKLKTKRIEFFKPQLKKLFKNLDTLPEIKFDDLGGEVDAKITNIDKKPVIVVNSRLSTKEVIPSILHELVGHFGATKVFNEINRDLAKYAYELFQRAENTNDPLIAELKELYGNNKEVLFDEWIAKNLEKASQEYFDEKGTFLEDKFNNDKTLLKKVVDLIRKLTDKILDKLFNQKLSQQEVDTLFKATLQEFGKIQDIEYTGDTRYSKSETKTEEKPKTKRKPPKSLTAKEKARTYVSDKTKLKLSTDKNVKIRFYDFVNKHLYGQGADSYRRQIFDLIDKVKSVGDENFQKALQLVDESIDYKKAVQAHQKVERFRSRHKAALGKVNSVMEDVVKGLDNIKEKYQMFVDYNTLKRLEDRGGKVLKPTYKGKETRIGLKYQNVVEQKYVEITSNNGESYYTITPEGKIALGKIKAKLTDTEGVMFGAEDINNQLIELRDKFKAATEDLKDFKVVKNEKLSDVSKELIDHITKNKNVPDRGMSKWLKAIRDKMKYPGNSLGRMVSPISLDNDNLDYISQYMDGYDDNGVFQKAFSFGPTENRNRALEMKQSIEEAFKDEISKNFTKKELKEMSDELSVGTVDKTVEMFKNKKVQFKLQSGEVVETTPAKLVMAYMISQSDRGYNTITKGGLAKDRSDTKPTVFTDQDISNLEKMMSDKQKKLAEIFARHYDMMAEYGNMISNEDVGYPIFTEEGYVPFQRVTDYIEDENITVTNVEQLRKVAFRGLPSITKARQDATSPLLLEDPFIAMARHFTLFNQYAEMVLVTKKMDAIINDKDFVLAMKKNGFEPELREIQDIIRKKTMVEMKDIYEGGFKTLNSMFVVAVLGYKPSVALSQAVGTILYFPEMKGNVTDTLAAIADVKNWFKKSSENEKIKMKEMLEKYSPILKDRFNSSIEITKVGSPYRPTAANMTVGKKRFVKDLGFLTSPGAMAWTQNMDTLGIVWIGKLIEVLETKNLEKGSEEYYKYIAKRTELVTRRTQQTFDSFDASLLSQSKVMRPFTRFLSQPLKAGMLLRRELYLMGKELKAGNKTAAFEHGAKAFITVVSQSVGVEVLKTAVKAIGGDIEDEEWQNPLYWLKSLLSNTLAFFGLPGIVLAGVAGGWGTNAGGNVGAMLETFEKSWKKSGEAIRRRDVESFGDAIYTFARAFLPIGGPEQLVKMSVGLAKFFIDLADGK